MTHTYPNINGSGDLHIQVLKAICGETAGKSVVDLCCGEAITTRQLGFQKRTYVDLVKRDIQEENQYFVNKDVFEFLQGTERFDVAIILDGIEHFKFWNGYNLLAAMEACSDKQIIFTPLGDYMTNYGEDDHNPDSHKSGWTPEHLPAYNTLVFPHFHPTLGAGGLGAFYAWKCVNLAEDFDRAINLIKL